MQLKSRIPRSFDVVESRLRLISRLVESRPDSPLLDLGWAEPSL